MIGILFLIFSVVALEWCLSTTASAQKQSPPAKTTSKARRIIILGATIVGSIAKPRIVYEVPWREPESLQKALDEPHRSFYDEIFILLDKEQFESEVDQAPK